MFDFSEIPSNQSFDPAQSTTTQVNSNDTKKETNSSNDNTDEILAELVSSGFDLNILDKWDKIKSN